MDARDCLPSASGSRSSCSAAVCQHYKRNCWLYTVCCDKAFHCRICHDSQHDHQLRREDVTHIVCSGCRFRQTIGPECTNCGIRFAKYFCPECKLFDDQDKDQFHCDGCGICRIGGRQNYFHCDGCSMCLPIHMRGNHTCIENLSRSDCPICLEDIHTSREPSQIPPCNHLIHKACFEQLLRSGHYYCPVCARSLVDLRQTWLQLDKEIERMAMPDFYRRLLVAVQCRDCQSRSIANFHIFGLKCVACGSYNTARDKGPMLRYSQTDGQVEEVSLSELMNYTLPEPSDPLC